jgi:hyperosmotically inducible protein
MGWLTHPVRTGSIIAIRKVMTGLLDPLEDIMRTTTLIAIGITGMLLAGLPVGIGGASVTLAAQQDRSQAQLFRSVERSILGYEHYSIFDSVKVRIAGDTVTLIGKVTMDYKKDDLGKRVAGLRGVARVENRLEVFPASKSDEELRTAIANAIYSHPTFQPYAAQPNPPIHIIVERGRVTLVGVVLDESERLRAVSLAGSRGALQIHNELKTPAEAAKELAGR